MSPAQRDPEPCGRRFDGADPLPGFTEPRARALAAEWDDDGLWDDVAWLGRYFWARTDAVDHPVRWHHLVLAAGNFKRPRARWLRPGRLEGIPLAPATVPDSFETPAGLRVDREDPASWESLRSSLTGADVSTTASLLAALWPAHHFVFDWRVRDAASGLRLAGGLSPCPGVEPSLTGGEPSPLDFTDYTLVRSWLRALDLPLLVSQRALYCLSRKAGNDPSRRWSDYAEVLLSILASTEDPRQAD